MGIGNGGKFPVWRVESWLKVRIGEFRKAIQGSFAQAHLLDA